MPKRRPVRGLIKVDALANWLTTFEVRSWHQADLLTEFRDVRFRGVKRTSAETGRDGCF